MKTKSTCQVWSLTKLNLVAALSRPLARPLRANRSKAAVATRTPVFQLTKQPKPYHGRYQPQEFPPGLERAVAEALQKRDGHAVIFLLKKAGYFWQAWERRNRWVRADYLPQALEGPIKTLIRMIGDGELPTPADLRTRIAQVLAMDGRKYGTRSYNKDNPKLNYRNRKNTEDKEAAAANVFITGMPLPVDKTDNRYRPDQEAQASELEEILEQTSQFLDPLELAIFEAVQEYRLTRGVSGAYPFVAGMLDFDKDDNPIAWQVINTGDSETTPAQVANVRQIFLKIRGIFEKRVIAAGYTLPSRPRPAKRRTKTHPS